MRALLDAAAQEPEQGAVGGHRRARIALPAQVGGGGGRSEAVQPELEGAGTHLGGLLVTSLGWHWIFYVNIPVGLVIIAFAFLLVSDLRPGRRHRLDFTGILLATLGLLGVVHGVIEGER